MEMKSYFDHFSEIFIIFFGTHFSVVKVGCGTTLGNVFEMCQYENLAQNKQKNQYKETERKNQR